MTTLEDQSRAARYQRQQKKRRNSIKKIHNQSSYASPELIIAFSLGLMAVIAFFASVLHAKMADAFVVSPLPTRHRSNTKIFLEGKHDTMRSETNRGETILVQSCFVSHMFPGTTYAISNNFS